MAGANCDTRFGAVSEHEHGSGRVGMFLDLTLDTSCLGFALRKVARVGVPGCVDDADLGKRSRLLVVLTTVITYHYAVLACTFVDVSRVGLALVGRTTLLVGGVKDVEVVVVNVVTSKDIGDEFQE